MEDQETDREDIEEATEVQIAARSLESAIIGSPQNFKP